MTISKHKNLILIASILFIAFLIESPLYTQAVSLFSFLPMLGYLIVGKIGYIAMLVCVLIITNQYLNKANLFKALGLIFAFAVIDQIISMSIFTEISAMLYQIIRPVISVVFICLTIKLISKCKFKKDIKLLVIGIIVFMFDVGFNVLEYILIITVMQNLGNDFFSLFRVLTLSNNVYNMMATFCDYILSFIAFVFAEKCICYKNSDI